MAYATVDELAAELRVTVTAANTSRLQSCLDAAAFEINHRMDRTLDAGTIPTTTYHFATATAAADPGPGFLRLDKASPSAAQHLYADSLDANGVTQTGWAQAAAGDILRLTDTTGAWEQFTANGAGIDHVGWYEVPVDRTDVTAPPPALAQGDLLTVAAFRPTVLRTEALALAKRDNLNRASEWWKANDFTTPGAPLRVPGGYMGTVLPLKQRWGVS